jgi:hypothetical protein
MVASNNCTFIQAVCVEIPEFLLLPQSLGAKEVALWIHCQKGWNSSPHCILKDSLNSWWP